MIKRSVIWALFALFAISLNGQKIHPAFGERISERHHLAYRVLKNYPGIQVYDTAVLGAIYRTPRHAFVPDRMKPYAYENTPLPIGYEQTISQPVIVASMTQMLDPQPGMKILEIGTGSGYQAAVLAELNVVVFSIEIVTELGIRAKKLIDELGYTNVHIKIGDGYEGWPEEAPFDRIIVTCAPEEVPEPLISQLKTGGKIVIPVGSENTTQYLVVLRKDQNGKIIRDTKYAVRFVPMTGKAEKVR
ncbi:MAG: protein-L-isoaspartate(D-aspartate) O-methyltransferase [Bacteroidales bacterium]